MISQFQDRSRELPIASFENLMSDPVPAVIVGRPFEGKSFTLDRFLKMLSGKAIPFLLLDSSYNNHIWIQKTLSFYKALTLNWLKNPGPYRLSLEKDLDLRRSAVREMSKAILRLENNPSLSNWVIAVEEAHDYSRVESFLTLLRRMRKSTRKLVIVSTESKLFQMCKPLRPLPKSISGSSSSISSL